jgi:2-haloacid dehalogenase
LLDSWSLWDSVAGSVEQGRVWRAEYLRLTYGCGDYVPYESLVRDAARQSGLSASAAQRLDDRWQELAPWSCVAEVLGRLTGKIQLAVVTNCSRRLGQQAADRVLHAWDCVVTAEDAGAYKPDPRPYRMALARLGVSPAEAVFVAGSGYDLFGTSAVGLRTYWHNRVGLHLPTGAPPPAFESATLDALPAWLSLSPT